MGREIKFPRYIFFSLSTEVKANITKEVEKAFMEKGLTEGPFSVFTGALRLKLEDIAEKTGNPKFFIAYLWARRELLEKIFRNDAAVFDFLVAMEHIIDATKAFKPDSSGALIPSKLVMTDTAIILLVNKTIHHRETGKDLTSKPWPSDGTHPKKGVDPDVDGFGGWGRIVKLNEE